MKVIPWLSNWLCNIYFASFALLISEDLPQKIHAPPGSNYHKLIHSPQRQNCFWQPEWKGIWGGKLSRAEVCTSVGNIMTGAQRRKDKTAWWEIPILFLISLSAGEFLVSYFLAMTVAHCFRKPVHVECSCQACILVGSIDFLLLKFLMWKNKTHCTTKTVFSIYFYRRSKHTNIFLNVT